MKRFKFLLFGLFVFHVSHASAQIAELLGSQESNTTTIAETIQAIMVYGGAGALGGYAARHKIGRLLTKHFPGLARAKKKKEGDDSEVDKGGDSEGGERQAQKLRKRQPHGTVEVSEVSDLMGIVVTQPRGLADDELAQRASLEISALQNDGAAAAIEEVLPVHETFWDSVRKAVDEQDEEAAYHRAAEIRGKLLKSIPLELLLKLILFLQKYDTKKAAMLLPKLYQEYAQREEVELEQGSKLEVVAVESFV